MPAAVRDPRRHRFHSLDAPSLTGSRRDPRGRSALLRHRGNGEVGRIIKAARATKERVPGARGLPFGFEEGHGAVTASRCSPASRAQARALTENPREHHPPDRERHLRARADPPQG